MVGHTTHQKTRNQLQTMTSSRRSHPSYPSSKARGNRHRQASSPALLSSSSNTSTQQQQQRFPSSGSNSNGIPISSRFLSEQQHQHLSRAAAAGIDGASQGSSSSPGILGQQNLVSSSNSSGSSAPYHHAMMEQQQMNNLLSVRGGRPTTMLLSGPSSSSSVYYQQHQRQSAMPMSVISLSSGGGVSGTPSMVSGSHNNRHHSSRQPSTTKHKYSHNRRNHRRGGAGITPNHHRKKGNAGSRGSAAKTSSIDARPGAGARRRASSATVRRPSQSQVSAAAVEGSLPPRDATAATVTKQMMVPPLESDVLSSASLQQQQQQGSIVPPATARNPPTLQVLSRAAATTQREKQTSLFHSTPVTNVVDQFDDVVSQQQQGNDHNNISDDVNQHQQHDLVDIKMRAKLGDDDATEDEEDEDEDDDDDTNSTGSETSSHYKQVRQYEQKKRMLLKQKELVASESQLTRIQGNFCTDSASSTSTTSTSPASKLTSPVSSPKAGQLSSPNGATTQVSSPSQSAENNTILSKEEEGFFSRNPIPLNPEISQRKRHKLPTDARKLNLIYTNPTRFVLPKQKIKRLVSAALSQPKSLSRRNSVATMNSHGAIVGSRSSSSNSGPSSRSSSVSSRSGGANALHSGNNGNTDSKVSNKTFQSDKNPLKFNSAFESGNLYRAFAYPSFDSSNYILLLRSDPGMFNTLWFYFSVSGQIDPEKEYTFNVVNIVNHAKNWHTGQLPLVFAKEKPSGTSSNNVNPPTLKDLDQWQRSGTTYCRYFKTRNSSLSELAKKQLPVTKRQKNRRLNTLTFKVRFGDIKVKSKKKKYVYFFAFGLPFTYTDCLRHIKVQKRRVAVPRAPSTTYAKNIYFQSESLCKSILRYDCPILTITNKGQQNTKPSGATPIDALLRNRKKRGIIISGRVHPGETSGSHVCRALIDFLLSPDSELANSLRNQFVFKIVPILNPDGVINGNNRTAATRSDFELSDRGVNLNSVWHKIQEQEHPTLFHLNKMIRNMTDERKCILYLDIHGHYSQIGHFVFGYASKENKRNQDSFAYRFPRNLVSICDSKPNGERMFEFDEDFIYDPDYYSSDGVAPVEVMRSHAIPASYTLETCMSGSENFHYSRHDYALFAQCVCEAILETFDHEKRLKEKFGI